MLGPNMSFKLDPSTIAFNIQQIWMPRLSSIAQLREEDDRKLIIHEYDLEQQASYQIPIVLEKQGVPDVPALIACINEKLRGCKQLRYEVEVEIDSESQMCSIVLSPGTNVNVPVNEWNDVAGTFRRMHAIGIEWPKNSLLANLLGFASEKILQQNVSDTDSRALIMRGNFPAFAFDLHDTPFINASLPDFTPTIWPVEAPLTSSADRSPKSHYKQNYIEEDEGHVQIVTSPAEMALMKRHDDIICQMQLSSPLASFEALQIYPLNPIFMRLKVSTFIQ